MPSRRSSYQISIDVLRIIKSGESKPTRIMYGAKLSWTSLKKQLKYLTENDFIREVTEAKSSVRSKKRYFITERGRNVLKYHKNIEKLVQLDAF